MACICCLCLPLIPGSATAQGETFRGVITQKSYVEDNHLKPSLSTAVVSDILGTTTENFDTFYSTMYVCNDTIISTYHGREPIPLVVEFDHGGRSYIFYPYSEDGGVEVVRTALKQRDLGGTTGSDWKKVRNNKRDAQYQDFDYRMVHPQRQTVVHYASVDESEVYLDQFELDGHFANVFHPYGLYKDRIQIIKGRRYFYHYTYTVDLKLNCAEKLLGIRVREREDPDVIDQFTYAPQTEPLPEAERRPFETVDVRDSTGLGSVFLDEFAGQYVLIDWWATWCLPCRQEMPFLQSIQEEYADDGLSVVSLSVDREEDLMHWIEQRQVMQMDWTNWIMYDGIKQQPLATTYPMKGIPTYFILDPQGRVMYFDAPRPSDRRLREVLDGLLR